MIQMRHARRPTWLPQQGAGRRVFTGAALLVGVLLLVLASRPRFNTEALQNALPPLAHQAFTAVPGAAPVLRSARPEPSRTPKPGAVGATVPAVQRTEVEICGFGTVALKPDDPYPLQAIAPAMRESALDAAEALMLASDDVQARAAALWIGMQRGKRDAHARVEQIARMAVGSQDPVVYALAVEACKAWMGDDPGSCNLINREQWARLDADNAVPWLELAAQARQNMDADTEQQALRMAAHARHINTRDGLLPTLVDRALGTRLSPLQRTLALSESWSAQAVWAVSHAPHADLPVAKHSDVPDVDLDLSCGSVERMQDWMRQRNLADLAARGAPMKITN